MDALLQAAVRVSPNILGMPGGDETSSSELPPDAIGHIRLHVGQAALNGEGMAKKVPFILIPTANKGEFALTSGGGQPGILEGHIFLDGRELTKVSTRNEGTGDTPRRSLAKPLDALWRRHDLT